jgi:hypothetical protein
VGRTQSLSVVVFVFSLVIGHHDGLAEDQKGQGAANAPIASTDDTPYVLNTFFVRTLRTADWETLSKLQASHDTSVAIQAAWEHVRRSLPNERPEYEGHRPPSLDQKAANRFLGFVEGRLPVTVPPWWQELILKGRGHAHVDGSHWHEFKGSSLGRYYEQGVGDRNEDVLLVGPGIRVERYTPELLELDIGGKVIGFPMRTTVRCNVSAAIVKDGVYVAVSHSWTSATSQIVAVDADRKEVIWKKMIWGEVPLVFRSGAGGFHWIDFRSTASEVIVFGAMDDVVYAEAFAIADGKPKWRFSSTYCSPTDASKRE